LGCSTQWNTSSTGWGAQYGGVSSESDCSSLPDELQSGCEFRFEWYEDADNPAVTFEQIECPDAITSVSGIANNDLTIGD